MKRLLLTGLILASVPAIALAHMPSDVTLLAPDGVAGDHFGESVAIHLDTIVVGAPDRHDNGSSSGAAYVFIRTGAYDWEYEGKLLPSDGAPGDRFGEEVAIFGDYAVVGAPGDQDQGADTGSAYIFRRVGTTWTQEAKLLASDAAGGHFFAEVLSASGDSIAVSARGNEAGYVFVDAGSGLWTEQQKISASDGVPGDEFAHGISIRDDGLIVGSPMNDEFAADGGAFYYFTRTAGVWSEQSKHAATIPTARDQFGWSVCIGNVFTAVGAPGRDDQGPETGAMYEYRWDGSTWETPEGSLISPFAPAGAGDRLGDTVGSDGQSIIAGQPLADLQGTESGGAQLFEDGTSGWGGDVFFPGTTTNGDELGSDVAISRCWMVAGARRDDDMGNDSGAAFAFLQDHPAKQVAYCTAGTSSSGCQATLSATGAASASMETGFVIQADAVEGSKDGLFFFGANGRQANSWGSGTSFQCVLPPVSRGGLLTAIGTPGQCDGRFAQDFNALWCPTCPGAAKNPGPGVLVQAQLWYRDPQNTSNQSTSLSNALEFATCP